MFCDKMSNTLSRTFMHASCRSSYKTYVKILSCQRPIPIVTRRYINTYALHHQAVRYYSLQQSSLAKVNTTTPSLSAAMSLSLCQLPGNQFVGECKAQVLSCAPLPTSSDAGKGKKAKKGEVEAPTSTEPVARFSVILSQTCLFPEGGGQPSDKGFIGSEPVLFVSRCPTTGAVSHHTQNAVEVSSPTSEPVTIRADLVRRIDHMQQHTAQHLISAVCKRDFSAPTMSWNMAKFPEPSFIELETETAGLTSEQMTHLADTLEGLISANTPVVTRVFPSAEEAAEDPDYKQALAVGRAKAFPVGLVGPARSVEIAGLEFNTCCGTHAPGLGFLQSIALLRAEKFKGHTKLFFNAGRRITVQYEEFSARAMGMTKALGAPQAEHLEAVEKLQASLKAKMKETDALVTRFAESIFTSLTAPYVSSTPVSSAPVGIFYAYPHADGVVDMKVLLAVASAFQEWTTQPAAEGSVKPKAVCLFSPSGAAPLPTAEDVTQAQNNTTLVLPAVEGLFVIAGEKGAVADLGPKIAQIVNGRGGGRPGLYQGRAQNLEKCFLVENMLQ